MTKTTEKHPIEKSVGSQNAHTFWCDTHQQRRNYGVCLWLKDSYESGRIKSGEEEPYNDCANAMCKGTCQALTMRKEEEKAGHAIYFRTADYRMTHENMGRVDKSSDSYKRGWNQVGDYLKNAGKSVKQAAIKITSTPKPSPVVKKEPEIAQPTLADAITQAVKDEVKTVTMAEFVAMKKRIVELAKSDPKEAKKLLMEAKRLEKLKLITA